MASTEYFASQAVFPDDLQPIAQMATISLARLVAGSTAEADVVLHACRKLGFFLLDLTGNSIGEQMIAEVDAMFDVVRQTMELSMAEKKKFNHDPPRDFRGYKAQGLMKTETGAPDRCEFYSVSQDDLLGQSTAPRDNPEPIASHTQLLRSYLEHGQFVLTHILRTLATQLDLHPETFRNLQEPSHASGTILRLIRYAPSLISTDMRTGLLPHTDFGSVTLYWRRILRPRTRMPGSGCVLSLAV
ncbi:hypothetical protein BGW36DRAFT_418938 [Talaromyces proteolyticus]|uniref:Non-haem dioxygenase N-terminal domain-containing protein n=1 Tax=Talaromyces proteolyticus TaxID=1131652 RepID=A0AAD4KJZ5_9EURO|nr:uncharacterized protein BGW36DRAFT_418938 [Talaromyces proteolyticus]KAH8692773.1 hypothetical protein BGW36DRAFT_418938 [Talaromyces proteolyticus]